MKGLLGFIAIFGILSIVFTDLELTSNGSIGSNWVTFITAASALVWVFYPKKNG